MSYFFISTGRAGMTISKSQKIELVKQYVQDLKAANNVVVLQQSGLPVTLSTTIRKEVGELDGKYNVVRKRLFSLALKEAGFDVVSDQDLDGSIVVLYANNDEYAPMKLINNYAKKLQSDKEQQASIKFLGGWYEKKWHDSEYVTELANIPAKEELISKLAYLFNYPLQSFAGVLDQISKKLEA